MCASISCKSLESHTSTDCIDLPYLTRAMRNASFARVLGFLNVQKNLKKKHMFVFSPLLSKEKWVKVIYITDCTLKRQVEALCEK